MAQKTKRSSAEDRIREAVRTVLGAGKVTSFSYALPAERGAQLSMAGDTEAWGNRTVFPAGALAEALGGLPSMKRVPEEDRRRYAQRMRFFIQPGDCDRFVAAAVILSELTAAGFAKILIAADTPVERDALASFLSMTRAGIGNAAATVYTPGEYGAGDVYPVFASVYGFLTSPGPQILLLDAASFCRRTNLLRREILTGGEGARSFSDLIAEGRPALLISARTADSARNIARAAEVFDPSLTMLLCTEDKRLRDAVISRPERKAKRAKSGGGRQGDFPEQIRF